MNGFQSDIGYRKSEWNTARDVRKIPTKPPFRSFWNRTLVFHAFIVTYMIPPSYVVKANRKSCCHDRRAAIVLWTLCRRQTLGNTKFLSCAIRLRTEECLRILIARTQPLASYTTLWRGLVRDSPGVGTSFQYIMIDHRVITLDD